MRPLLDLAAGGDVLGVVRQKRLREIEHRGNARIGDAVEDLPTLAPRLDEPAPAEACEMVRDLRLRKSKARDEVAHRQLALAAQKLQDPNPGGVAEPAEVLRHEVRRQQRCWKPEGRGAGDARHEAAYIKTF
jgi:hypothetical protein